MPQPVRTRPRHILAATRMRTPRAPRDDRAKGTPRPVARALRARGIASPPPPERLAAAGPAPLPRVHARRPAPDHLHPAPPFEIVRLLRAVGDECITGLRIIELAPAPPVDDDRFVFGRQPAPGVIVLYAQPRPPWRIARVLTSAETARLRAAGAHIECGKGGPTVVYWPGTTLRDFMLFDVLMREIGHHLLRQYRGSRPLPAARTTDHEAFAARFAARWRARAAELGFSPALSSAPARRPRRTLPPAAGFRSPPRHTDP